MNSTIRCKNCPQLKKQWKCVGNFERNNFTREEIRNDITKALKLLYKNDIYLLKVRANEVCISTHFFTYFDRLFSKRYINLNIDPEYSRNGETAKFYEVDKKSKEKYHYAKPDMIIHKRNCNFHNIVYIEFKPYWNTQINEDYNKLSAFTNPNELFFYKDISYSYSYKYGTSIILDLKKVYLNWFKDGGAIPFCREEVDCETWSIRQLND